MEGKLCPLTASRPSGVVASSRNKCRWMLVGRFSGFRRMLAMILLLEMFSLAFLLRLSAPVVVGSVAVVLFFGCCQSSPPGQEGRTTLR